jgi:hypothetical protein
VHAVVRTPDVHPRGLEPPEHPGVGRSHRRSDERQVHVGDDLVHRPDVVPVVVGQHEQVDPVDAEQIETAPQPSGVVADVDERRARTVPQEHRIPLPDVAHRHGPVPR